MQPDSINSNGNTTKPEKYPVKHKRPVGQIIQRAPNRFLVWVHSHTDSNGLKKRYTKMWATLREADADLARVVAQRNRGKGIVDTNETLYAFIERFLSEAHAHRVKPYVHGKVTRAFKAWVYPFLGYKRVRSITATDIQKLYATLRSRISPRTNAPLSEATILRVHVHLRMVFNWGMRVGELSRHPMENLTVRKPPRQKIVTFSERQIRLFLEKWEEYKAEHPLRIPYGCIFQVAYETGMRPEEYLGLQFSDLHLYDNPPHIRVQRVAIRDIAKGGWWFDEPKTASSIRNIPISGDLAKLLRLQKLTIENYKLQRQSNWRENDLVFPNQTGEPIYQYLLTDLFREIVKQIGLNSKSYRLYTMRHTMATRAIARKVNVKAVSERLGHADISRTLETYTHVLPSMQLEAVDVLGGIAYSRESKLTLVSDSSTENEEARPC